MKMTTADWEYIERYGNFSRKEKWGDPYKVEKELVYRLQLLRDLCRRPIIIHTAYATSGHAKNSQHYLGKAADIHIKDMPLSVQFYYAIRAGFRGIGVYPYWNNPGLHVDVREDNLTNAEHKVEKIAMWLRYDDGSYVSIDPVLFAKIVVGTFDNI